MRVIITYGTFDLFHEGHYRLLKRARELGDYLIVGVTTSSYDDTRGKLNVKEDLMQRIDNVKKSGLADKIIIEEYEGQKIEDIQRYNVDIFAIGSDWQGKFDYLNEYCKVTYLERTKGISSTKLRNENNGLLKLGIVGYGRIANRFITESKYVSGVTVEGVYGLNEERLKKFVETHELSFYETNYENFLDAVQGIYIASPHLSHYEYIKSAIKNKKHVLCEKPLVLLEQQAKELYSLAAENKVVLLEAIKTAYSPGFIRLISLAKSGVIGPIKSVDASFTKLVSGDTRELRKSDAGGSINELSSYPILAAVKLLGANYKDIIVSTMLDPGRDVDIFSNIILRYENAVANLKVGLGVKSEGSLIIAGTKGYIYVSAPWWKTEFFEVKFENSSNNQKFFYKFEGDGLRYELAEFMSLINSCKYESYKLTPEESISINSIIENSKKNNWYIK